MGDNPDEETEILSSHYDLVSLPYEELAYHEDRIVDYETLELTDPSGIRLWRYGNSVEEYYHPVAIAQDCLRALNAYEKTGEPRFLYYTSFTACFMADNAMKIDDTIYFPYDFDFRLHGDPDDLMVAPWYSGMAQGQWLSVFVRLYYLTGYDRYLDIARKIFNSFNRFGEDIFTVFINDENYYWISEYPDPLEPNYTLNGFIYGLYGLYDYWWVLSDEASGILLCAGLHTLRDHISAFRVPNGCSYYCLKHKVQCTTYHLIHIEQLAYVSEICGDSFFLEMSDLFKADHYPDS